MCDNVIGTLPSRDGKTKCNLNARRDLKNICIRDALHPIQEDHFTNLCHTMIAREMDLFYKVLIDLKVLDGHSPNIFHCINF